MKPAYWDKAQIELSSRDPILKKIINKFKDEHLVASKNPFFTIINSIVGQQISTYAARSIKAKLDKLTKIKPETILSVREEELKLCGLSRMKINYLLGIAEGVVCGKINFKDLDKLSDEKVKERLIEIKGIGPWTAEMFLISYLARPNILPKSDIGIINSIIKLYGEKNKQSINFDKFFKKWHPWNTVASWYLWRNIDDGDVTY